MPIDAQGGSELMLAQFTAASTLREADRINFFFSSRSMFCARASNPDIDSHAVVNDAHECEEWNLLGSSH
jgi:hypothetical protein